MTTLGNIAAKHSVSNKLIHHQNLLSLSYGKIIRKNIKAKKGLLPASFDTYQIVKNGVIVMRLTDLQNDHKSLRVGLATEEGIISPAYTCFVSRENVLPTYLYQQLNHYDVNLKLFYQMGDGLRQTLSYTDIEPLRVSIPEEEEQNNVTSYYDYLETIITSNDKKLTKVRNMKQALLRKMFV